MPKSLLSNRKLRDRRQSLAYGKPAKRPWRVVPLAVGAVALTCASAAAAVEAIRGVSGDRYAIEILQDEIEKIV